MFDLSVLLNVEMQILIFFGLGLLLKKRGVTDGPIDAFLSTLILNLIMPVNIFLSFYRSVSVAVLKESLLLVLAGVIVVVLVLGMARLLPKSMPLEKKRIAQYSMLISNGSLIGLPLIEGLCGSMGVVYANIFMIPTRILSFSSGEKYFNTEWKPAGALSVMKKFFFNPITIAMILGFLFNLARIPLPGGLDAVFSSLSGCMSSAGAVVSRIDAAGQEIDKRGIIEGYRADQSVPADHCAVFDLDRGCGAAFKHAAADRRRAGQCDAGRLHGHDFLPQV